MGKALTKHTQNPGLHHQHCPNIKIIITITIMVVIKGVREIAQQFRGLPAFSKDTYIEQLAIFHNFSSTET